MAIGKSKKEVPNDAPAEVPVEVVAVASTACRYQADRDTVVDGEVFGIDAETGTAERVEAIVNGRFKRFKGVRATGALTAGVIDSVGCYALPEKAGVGR